MRTKQDRWRCVVAGVVLGWCAGVLPVAAQFSVLHSFTGGASDGSDIQGTLLASGSSLYGMTAAGGTANLGTVFRINNDGTGFTLLHEFAGGFIDGSTPHRGVLTLSGSTFYGMTCRSGSNDCGTIFQMNTNGTGFVIRHNFSPAVNDGSYPQGSLTMTGATFYGMTDGGGGAGAGTIFKMDSDGTAYTNLHEFTGALGDGSMPDGDVTLIGSTLYGLTPYGSASGANVGVIFKINTDGTGLTNLHNFAGGSSDGAYPYGSLTLVGSNFYGMTAFGGPANQGTIFKINTDGAGYTNLHYFTGDASDGGGPNGSLTLVGSALYGMTGSAGLSNYGAIFRINTDGTGYTNLHYFTGGTSDGAYPYGSLTSAGAKLYGMTFAGGVSNLGTVFALTIPAAPTGVQLFFQDSTGQVASWLLNTNGTFLAARLLGSAGAWQLKAAGDVDGDGASDLLFQSTSGDLAIWFMNTTGTVKSTRSIGNIGTWQLCACADYDGNGKCEFLFRNTGNTIAMWQTTTNGSCTNSIILGNAGGWQLKAATDVDGDGKADLFWQTATGQLAAWFHNPDGSILGRSYGLTQGWELRAAVDVDGNGAGDLLWQTPGYDNAGWLMLPNGSAMNSIFWSTTSGWKLKAAGR